MQASMCDIACCARWRVFTGCKLTVGVAKFAHDGDVSVVDDIEGALSYFQVMRFSKSTKLIMYKTCEDDGQSLRSLASKMSLKAMIYIQSSSS